MFLRLFRIDKAKRRGHLACQELSDNSHLARRLSLC
jgi:hypothetical protein